MEDNLNKPTFLSYEKNILFVIEKKLYLPFSIFTVILFIFLGLAISQKSIWIFDVITFLILLTAVFLFSKNLYINRTEFYMVCVMMILHLFGFFGGYSLGFANISYDKFEHLINSFLLTYILFNAVKHKLSISKKNIAFAIFLVISSAVALTFLTELLEFTGYFIVGPQDSILSPGSWLNATGMDLYIDTMTDIVANIIGSVLGAFYFKFRRL